VVTISLAVPHGSLGFWKQRFVELQVKHEDVVERFGVKRLVFYDNDEQKLELVESDGMLADAVWTKQVPQKYAIRCFYSATLGVVSRAMIDPVLTQVFGYVHVSSEGQTHLYRVNDSPRANFIEVCEEPSSAFGFNAAGTVHHIAFRARDAQEQLLLREQVTALRLYPTEVINRFYFKSVYFRTPAGILFEIATDGPGFTSDEAVESLGEKLSLPPFLEHEREMIEKHLVPIAIE
jgi:glyoxalase family protein